MRIFYSDLRSLRGVGLLFCLLLFAGEAWGQCDCDHLVTPDERNFYGDVRGVKPGDVICVQGGVRGQLRFFNVVGTEADPIVIKNCGGQVVINATGGGQAGVALCFNGNKYFHVTGTGDPAHTYGFKVGGETHATVEAQGRATNFEMDHIEVVSSGFAGFMIKTDPDAGERNVRPEDPDAVDGGFTMYDVSVHDCYIHDMLPDGEGIYMGHSFWSTGVPKVKGGDPTDRQYSHSIYGAKIYNNVIERTGREAIQAGSVVEGLEIYNNKIYDYGYKNPNIAQNNGIQIGEGSSGRIYNNLLVNGPDGGSRGIYLLGFGHNFVYNNVIIGATEYAINANLRPSVFPEDAGNKGFLGGAYIINNTIIDTKGASAFGTYLNNAPDNILSNNLVISAIEDWDDISGSNWTKSGNLKFRTLKEAGMEPVLDYYTVKDQSPVIDAGTDVSTYGVNIDYTGLQRPVNGRYEIGAFEYNGSGSGNSFPVLNVPSHRKIAAASMVNLTLTSLDADGDKVRFSANGIPPFGLFTDNGDNTATLTLTPGLQDGGNYSVDIEADDGHGGVVSSLITFEVEAAKGSPSFGKAIYRINAGGVEEADPDLNWQGDKKATPSPYFDSRNCVNYTTGSNFWSGVNHTHAPDNVFGPYRYDNGASFADRQHWNFPVENGQYEVRLYFKAVSPTAGADVFSVVVEEQTMLRDYDIFTAAGGANLPVEESFVVSVTDATLDIDFALVKGKSIVHGIEILSRINSAPELSGVEDQVVDEGASLDVMVRATDPDGDPLTLSAIRLPAFGSLTTPGDGTAILTFMPQTGDAGNYRLTVAAADGKGGSDSVEFILVVNEVEIPSGKVLYRINAGGIIEPDEELDWQGDKTGSPSPFFDSQKCVNYTTGSNFWKGVNTTHAPDNIFGPYRYDNGATFADRQHWNFPLSNGSYEVRLYFKAISTTAGSNVFDVVIEGKTERKSYDIFVAAGGSNIPVEESFRVLVNDGQLSINFPIVTGRSIVHGIEILSYGNIPPVLETVAIPELKEGGSVQLAVTAVDANGDPLVLSASGLPAFASFSDHGDATGLLTLSPQSGDAGEYSGLILSACDSKGDIDSLDLSFTVHQAAIAAGQVLYRVNAGGISEPDSELNWEGDKTAAPSSYFDSDRCVNYTTGSNFWKGTNNTSAPDNIFGPYRYDNGASFAERQHWDFPVANGSYEVRLYFRAVSSSTGTDVFDVELEGDVKLDDYDIYSRAGGSNIATEEILIVTVADGNLDIDFPLVKGKSSVNGIEIRKASPEPVVESPSVSTPLMSEILLYPNPVTEGKIKLQLASDWESGRITLHDLSGRVLQAGEISRMDPVIDVSDIQSGMYILRIEIGQELFTKKIRLQ